MYGGVELQIEEGGEDASEHPDEAKSGGSGETGGLCGVGAGRSMDEKTGKTWGSVWIGGLLPENIVDDAEFRRRDAFRCCVWHRVMGWLREWEAEVWKV